MYQVVPEAVNIVKSYEGFAPKKYLCPAGQPTIGYGHKIIKCENFDNVTLTKDDADKLLQEDLKRVYDDLMQSCKDMGLSDNQIGALVSLYYNLGGTKFRESTLFKLLKKGDLEQAANHITDFVYAHVDGKAEKLNGLVKRRAAEKALFLKA